MLNTIVLIIAALFSVVATAEEASKVEKEPPKTEIWGQESGGFRIRLDSAQGQVTEFHPGESLKWIVVAQNVSGHELLLLQTAKPDEFHVVTPSGKELVYDGAVGAKHRKANVMVIDRNHSRILKPWPNGQRQIMEFRYSWRLTDYGSERGWFDAGGEESIAVSLRQLGTYRMWAEYEVRADKTAPANTWQGKVKSNIFEWKVTELPVDKRATEITQDQENDVQLWLRENKYDPSGGAAARLQAAIVWTKNEGLALRLASVSMPENKASTALFFLSERAGSLSEIGIDGPYLKETAVGLLSRIERGESTEHLQGFRIGQLVALYLHLHPEDKSTRDRAVSVAKQQCRVPGLLARPGVHGKPATTALPIASSWEILLEADALHAGMTTEEAIGALGEPTGKPAGWLVWQEDNGGARSMPLSLRAAVSDGKVTAWEKGGRWR
jgi:hypothetical protein